MLLSVVGSTAFRDMMTEAQPRFAMPSRKHLSTKLLPQRAANVQMELKLDVSAEDVCLNVDLWSSRDMRSFMGITGHFVINFSLHSVMLACHRFYGSHATDHFRVWYQHLFVYWQCCQHGEGIQSPRHGISNTVKITNTRMMMMMMMMMMPVMMTMMNYRKSPLLMSLTSSHHSEVHALLTRSSWWWRTAMEQTGQMKWWCFRPLLCTLLRLNWAKQTPGIMRQN